MLRITREDEQSERAMLNVEGAIVTGSAALLESECFILLCAGTAVVLDLARVDFVDQEGVAALGRLGRAKVELRCRSGAVAGVLEAEGVRITLIRSSPEAKGENSVDAPIPRATRAKEGGASVE
jgi:hypothetical protein